MTGAQNEAEIGHSKKGAYSKDTNAKIFLDELKKYEEYFILPKVPKKANPSWFGFPLTIRDINKFISTFFCCNIEAKFIVDNCM